MCSWSVLYVFVFVRVVVKRVCVLFATACVLLLGLRFVCDVMFVCVGKVCVLFVMYRVMLYGVLLCVRGCCVCVWLV